LGWDAHVTISKTCAFVPPIKTWKKQGTFILKNTVPLLTRLNNASDRGAGLLSSDPGLFLLPKTNKRIPERKDTTEERRVNPDSAGGEQKI
jgi:hypothetical protein